MNTFVWVDRSSELGECKDLGSCGRLFSELLERLGAHRANKVSYEAT